ncbi:MAG: helix-turn-helix domain-containing protein [Armatimonadetes bacterium]|nr:helix-turn-helix domain-containing protein [Armatimonadota bacterium]
MDEILTTAEAAAYLKTSPDTLRKLARRGWLPALRLAHTWRFRRKDIEELFEERAVDRALVETAERRLATTREEDYVPLEEVMAKSERLP